MMMTNTNNNDENSEQRQKKLPPRVQKLATLTICMVPPPSYQDVWDQATKARTQLKDPGLFRWPPHVNLLYPFINIKPKKDDEEAGMGLVDFKVSKRLKDAIKAVEPFTVTLDHFGTFGGNKRGVLWVYPSSQKGGDSGSGEPVHDLYQNLAHEFPECASSRKDFNPHMTLSHFKCLQDAEAAQKEIEKWWPVEGLAFELTEIYLLQRKGDDGQFMRVATLGLGQNGTIEVHDPHLAFPDMPAIEEDWVRTERMALKARRNGPRKGRDNKTNTAFGEDPRRGHSRSVDAPEEIVAKQAARQAKRLEQEAKQQAGND